MSKTEELHKLQPLAESVLNGLQALENGAQQARNHLASLEKAGIVEASAYWQGGEYLYLHYPSRGGKVRQRKYVGKDPQRVAEALGKIERWKRHRVIKDMLQSFQLLATQLQYELKDIDAKVRRSNDLVRQELPAEVSTEKGKEHGGQKGKRQRNDRA